MSPVIIVCETGYRFNNSFTKILDGMLAVCKQNSYALVSLDLSEIRTAKYDNEPIIVLGISISWVISTIRFLCANKYHPIVVGFEFKNASCTFVTQNVYLDAYTLSYRFLSDSPGNCAFIGFNPDSLCDAAKYAGLLSAANDSDYPIDSNDIYAVRTTPTQCINDFIMSISDYDTIFCADEYSALLLTSRLQTSEPYTIISFGNLHMTDFCTVPFHTLSPDYFNISKIAIELYIMLTSCSSVFGSIVYIKSHFSIPADNCLPDTLPVNPAIPMPSSHSHCTNPDENILVIDLLNYALECCDATDIELLSGLQKNLTYEQIAEQLYMSTNSIKHRLKKFLTNAGIEDKKQFLELAALFKLDFSKSPTVGNKI